MLFQDNYTQARFGIEEIYFHENLQYDLLEKLYQRAQLCLDAQDPVIQKSVTHDMILIFRNLEPSPSIIYRFLKHLNQDKNRDHFIELNTLINEEDLFSAVKTKTFVLVTHRHLVNNTESL